MAAYIIFMREQMRDTGEFAKYMEAVPPTLEGHPVRPLALYGQLETLEGAPLEGVVIAEFPTMEAAQNWYRSPAYQEAMKHRLKAGDYRVILTEGL
ncbi:MAG: DUF1330 domain-containing protein [Nevskiaceae bacterium]|jgi:uncharacterized protein (DUF1330 family)|nr:DUF1330 domain-containing protein [Nevskiaceae bacterium]